MGVEFTIQYHHKIIEEDIPRLAAAWRTKIKTAIEKKLLHDPLSFGKPLRRSLKNYRKFRVGDY